MVPFDPSNTAHIELSSQRKRSKNDRKLLVWFRSDGATGSDFFYHRIWKNTDNAKIVCVGFCGFACAFDIPLRFAFILVHTIFISIVICSSWINTFSFLHNIQYKHNSRLISLDSKQVVWNNEDEMKQWTAQKMAASAMRILQLAKLYEIVKLDNFIWYVEFIYFSISFVLNLKEMGADRENIEKSRRIYGWSHIFSEFIWYNCGMFREISCTLYIILSKMMKNLNGNTHTHTPQKMNW